VAVTGYDGAVTERTGGGALPSSDDQSVDMPTSADPVRQREPDPIVAQLRERMERLPHGHPSSPYNDDGSRKPPLPDLSQYELPIPGDPDYRPEPSGASDADGPEAGQTSERAIPGTNADHGPETTTDQPELSEAPPDAEPATDAEYTGHAQGVREEPDQVWAWGLALNEEDTPGVRDEVSQEEGEASHDAAADDLDERATNEPPVPRDPDHQPEPSRVSAAEGPTEEASAIADDRQHTEDKAAADESAPDSAPRPSDSEDKPRSGPDGSWEWQGYPLTAEQSGAADRRIEKCQEAEGRDMDDGYGEEGITPAMRRIEAELQHGELVPGTEKFALKTADRFKEKLARMILDEPDADWHELTPRIADAIRYTFFFPDEEYISGATEVRESLESAGFELYEQKNAWADEAKAYKGINSAWMDAGSGLLFEVQMHTTASWNAKQEAHREYEVIESRSATAEEKEQARRRQDQIFANVLIPDGAAQIPTYRKEGW
jgi:hypothetical protein